MTHRSIGIMIGISTAILIVAALYLARSIIAPVAFAFFIVALVWPLQRTLQSVLPKLLALFITLAVTIVVLLVLASMTAWGFGRAAQWLVANAARFQALYMNGAEWLEGHGLYAAGTLMETFDVSWLIRFFQSIVTRLNGMVGFAVVTFIYVMLGLLEIDILQRKLMSAEGGATGQSLSKAASEIASKFRRYMVVRSIMSLLTGLAMWGFAAAAGLDLAFAWGVIAFALNYIPFVGPLVAMLLPTLFAVAQFEILADGGCSVRGNKRHPVLLGLLYRTAHRRQGADDVAFHRSVLGVFLGLHVGPAGRVHRRAAGHRGAHHL
nr:AI-2E family transporter [Paracoccus sp. (in: a-proteobacteria)]